MTSLYNTFYLASSFEGNYLSKWNVRRVTRIDGMTFYETSALSSCSKRFIYDSWHSSQDVEFDENAYLSWQTIRCDRSLSDALSLQSCYSSDVCDCESIDPEHLRCQNCGTIPTELGYCESLTTFSISMTNRSVSGTVR